MSLRSITRYLVLYPSLSAIAAGLAGFVLVVLFFGLLLLHTLEIEVREDFRQGGRRLERINIELAESFQHLNTQLGADCDAATLGVMRQHLLHLLSIRAFGMLNTQGQVVCLTSDGVLAQPITLPAPNLQLGGQNSWHDYPLHANPARPDLKMTLVSQGRFVVLIDQQLSQQIIELGHIDAIWLDPLASKRATLAWSSPRWQPSQLQAPAFLEWRNSGQSYFSRQFDWSKQRFVFSANVPHSSYVLQSYARLWDWPRHNRVAFFAILGLASFIALILGFFAQQRLEKINLLSFRIADLCRAEHVICMYQPIVDLRTQQIVGCEVLMRLQDEGKVLFPDQVLPLILAKQLGWALDAAVAQKALSELQQHLPTQIAQPFKVALNFFPENITHARLKSLLSPFQHERLLLNIEVTEYGVTEGLFADVQALRQDGYVISVDDFGTGYSNLGTVKRLSPDYLKIDRSFVFDMEDDSLRSSLIPEIVAIADAVGAQVIAEGVENASQSERLCKMGVQFGQGYYFGRPQPLADFLRTLQQGIAPAA